MTLGKVLPNGRRAVRVLIFGALFAFAAPAYAEETKPGSGFASGFTKGAGEGAGHRPTDPPGNQQKSTVKTSDQMRSLLIKPAKTQPAKSESSPQKGRR